jgi:regulation of enolase protein 1 (concanavalin A-like superfamily)
MVKLWDAATGREVRTLQGHRGTVTSVAFSPDGQRLVTGSADRRAKLWDAATGREILTLQGHTAEVLCVGFSSDGRRIVTGSGDATAKVWEAATPEQMAAWTAAERAHEARVQASRTEQEKRDRAARGSIQVVASSSEGRMRLQWRPVPNALGYQLYRGPAGAGRARLVRLSARPLVGTSFVDRGPRVTPGQPLTYAITPLVRGAGGKPAEGRGIILQATPVALPPGWSGSSINEGRLSGSALFDATGEITLRGAGDGIGGIVDSGYFLNRPVTGDFEITATLRAGPTDTHLWALAGLMLRESLQADARNAFFINTGSSGLAFQWRLTADAGTDGRWIIDPARFDPPAILRLTRRGNTVRAEYSLDEGKSFRTSGDPPIFNPPLAKTLYVGLAITSRDMHQISEATFRDLTIRQMSGEAEVKRQK